MSSTAETCPLSTQFGLLLQRAPKSAVGPSAVVQRGASQVCSQGISRRDLFGLSCSSFDPERDYDTLSGQAFDCRLSTARDEKLRQSQRPSTIVVRFSFGTIAIDTRNVGGNKNCCALQRSALVS